LDTDFSFGLFYRQQSIVGDGGQTGYLFGGLQSGFFVQGWVGTASITGSTSAQPLLQLI
jgi:hypothetical protein